MLIRGEPLDLECGSADTSALRGYKCEALCQLNANMNQQRESHHITQRVELFTEQSTMKTEAAAF